MKKKNLLVGIAAGAALISLGLMLSKNRRFNWRSLYNAAEDALENIKNRVIGGDTSDSDEFSASPGRQLANKARHKAEQHLATTKNGNQ